MKRKSLRLQQLFERKPRNVLNIYFTAGFPGLEDTKRVLKSLEHAGADLVEIGMPYSDPLADGPVIQRSSTQALANGMSLHKLFDQLREARQEVHLPIILMGYLNPVLQYGPEKFARACGECGIDGLILPDLPIVEYRESFKPLFDDYGLGMSYLVTPETSDERMKLLDANSSGFLYVVSSSSTTGTQKDFDQARRSYFERIKNFPFKNPTLIGFGIRDGGTFRQACHYANGAIVGSAFIRMLEASNDLEADIEQFVASLKSGTEAKVGT